MKRKTSDYVKIDPADDHTCLIMPTWMVLNNVPRNYEGQARLIEVELETRCKYEDVWRKVCLSDDIMTESKATRTRWEGQRRCMRLMRFVVAMAQHAPPDSTDVERFIQPRINPITCKPVTPYIVCSVREWTT